jgi:mycothiol system anti-sigma-R factor
MMMSNTSCHSALERIYPYLDGELTRYKKFQIKRHLGKCNVCSGVYSFEDRLKNVIGAAAADDLPIDAMDRLKTMLKEEGCEDL